MKRRIVVALVIIGIAVFSAAAQAAPVKSICVARFNNLTGEDGLDYVGHILADGIEKNLKALPKAEVISCSDLSANRPREQDISALCNAARAANAQIVVDGDYQKDGELFTINVSFYDVETEKNLSSSSFTSPLHESYKFLDELSILLADTAGLSYSEAQLKKMRLIPTSSTEAIEAYGKALLKGPRSNERGQLLLQAISFDSKYGDALTALGIYYYEIGKLGKAQETFERLVQAQPEYPNAYYNLGLVLNSRMHYTRAIDTYRLALEEEPDDPDIWNNIGIVYYRMGMYSDAESSFQKAMQIAPEQENAQANLSKLRGKLEGGLAERPLQPSARLKQYIEMGAALYASGDYPKALEFFSKALEVQPADFKANNNIALTYMKMGYFDKAKEHFQRALQADPTAIDVKENLVYLETVALRKSASAAPQPAPPSSPDNAPALRAAGKVHLARKAYSEAERVYLQALEQEPDDIDSLHGLGLAYLGQNKFEKAREQFKKELTLDPENEEARNRLKELDFIFSARGLPQPSLQLSITPEVEARGHLVRANELYQAGDYQASVAEYRRAADLAPTSLDIFNNLGVAYAALGNVENAKAAFQRAMVIDPQNETVSKNLEKIELMIASHQMQSAELYRIDSTSKEKAPAAPPTDKIDTLESVAAAPEESAPAVAAEPAPVASERPASSVSEEPARVVSGESAPAGETAQPGKAEPEEIIAKNAPEPKAPKEKKEVSNTPPSTVGNSTSQNHFNMGIFKEGKGDFEGALVSYREAVRLEPNNAVAQYNLGNIYFRLGAFESAIECYLAAVKADAKFGKCYNNIGVAYYKLGRIEEAAQAWKRAIEVDPTLESARDNLSKYGGG